MRSSNSGADIKHSSALRWLLDCSERLGAALVDSEIVGPRRESAPSSDDVRVVRVKSEKFHYVVALRTRNESPVVHGLRTAADSLTRPVNVTLGPVASLVLTEVIEGPIADQRALRADADRLRIDWKRVAERRGNLCEG